MGDTWLLSGECVLGWARRKAAWRTHLPAALSPFPGPLSVIGARYDDSPVGPYLEFSVAEPARVGRRIGMCVTTMVVTSPQARSACRDLWGLPAEVGALRWAADGDERALVWEDRQIILRARPRGPWLPAPPAFRSLQIGATGPVRVRRRLGSRARPAELIIEAPTGDGFASLQGRHPGGIAVGVRMVACPARRPAGLLSSIPVRVRGIAPGPEPAALTAYDGEVPGV